MNGASARWVYKVATREAWAEAHRLGAFAGSADDRRDGFIHLSARHQLEATLARHFQGRVDLVLIKIEACVLGDPLRWEPSRDGELFPHLYASLPTEAACAVHTLNVDAEGKPILPQDF